MLRVCGAKARFLLMLVFYSFVYLSINSAAAIESENSTSQAAQQQDLQQQAPQQQAPQQQNLESADAIMQSSPQAKPQKNGKRNSLQVVHDSAVTFANWIDKFFGEAEELESASYDFLRLVNTVGWREGEGIEYRPRVKAKVQLPKIDKKFSLLFADNNDITSNQFEANQNDQLFDKSRDDHKKSAALNYESSFYGDSKFDTRIGIDSSFDSFVMLKHTLPLYQNESLLIRNFNYLFWKEEDKFGANTRFELDKVIDENNLFRWKYSILRSEVSRGNEWRNTFSLVNRFSTESWLSYDMDIYGATEDTYDVEAYRLALRFRRQLDIKWLYFEIEPELLWQRKLEWNDRRLVPGLILRLEIQFED